MKFEIIRLTDRPQMAESAAQWFHEKWGVPRVANEESIEECLADKSAVPQWYLALENERIVGGASIQQNIWQIRMLLSITVMLADGSIIKEKGPRTDLIYQIYKGKNSRQLLRIVDGVSISKR